MKFNHYLAELGLKETDSWFNDNQEDVVEPSRYEPDEEGFRDSDFWSLDYHLAIYIYSHLCYFREYCLCGHPMGMTFEEWSKIIDDMIEAFKLYIISDTDRDNDYFLLNEEERIKLSKRKNHKMNKGFRLFAKWFPHLWY